MVGLFLAIDQHHAISPHRDQHRFDPMAAGHFSAGGDNIAMLVKSQPSHFSEFMNVRRDQAAAFINRGICLFRVSHHHHACLFGKADDMLGRAVVNHAFIVIRQDQHISVFQC